MKNICCCCQAFVLSFSFLPLFKKGVMSKWVISKVNLHVFIGGSFQNIASVVTGILVLFSGATSLALGTSPLKLILGLKVYLGLDVLNSTDKSFKHSCTSGQYSYQQTWNEWQKRVHYQIPLSEALRNLEEPLTKYYQCLREMFIKLQHVSTLIYFNQNCNIFEVFQPNIFNMQYFHLIFMKESR